MTITCSLWYNNSRQRPRLSRGLTRQCAEGLLTRSEFHGNCAETSIFLKVAKLLSRLQTSFRDLKIGFLKGGTMGHKRPRAPKIQMKVTVLSEHRVMLRALATAEGKNMGDKLGEMIEREWKRNRKKKTRMRIGKLLRGNIRVFLEHELLADKMRLFGWSGEDRKPSGLYAVPHKALAAVKALLQRLGLSWPAPADDEHYDDDEYGDDDDDDTDIFGFR